MSIVKEYIEDIKTSVECLGDSDGFKTTALESLDELQEILEAVPGVESALLVHKYGYGQDSGYNVEGDPIDLDYDCPKCGKELDEEYKLCECGYFKEVYRP